MSINKSLHLIIKIYINSPSEWSNGSPNNRILVDSDNFRVGDNLKGFLGNIGQLPKDPCKHREKTWKEVDRTNMHTDEKRRFHESPGRKVGLGLLIGKVTIATADMCKHV